MFEIFLKYNIFISPTKLYLNYSNVALLGQQVNSLGLTTLEQKLEAIRLLSYPETLGALEYYLSLIGYLKNYIHFYTQFATPLQSFKIVLLRAVPLNGQKQKVYASKTKLGLLTLQELVFLKSIQKVLSRLSLLMHHNPNIVL